MLQTKLFHGGAGAVLEHAYYYLLQFAADHFLVPLSIGKDVEHYRGRETRCLQVIQARQGHHRHYGVPEEQYSIAVRLQGQR